VLQRETQSIPVVFVNLADPVGTGLIPSLAKPSGNMTGFTAFEFSITGKAGVAQGNRARLDARGAHLWRA
jgi:hypothetical protein